jgi:hypothetical protein
MENEPNILNFPPSTLNLNLMLNYQVTDNTVNLSFSKDLLSAPEIVKLIETLRIKELLTHSQLTVDDATRLDEDLKANWWQQNKDRFLDKL